MAKSAVDAEVKNQIFRKDFSAIIAMRRDLAQLSGARLKYDASGYAAGQVLARRTSTGVFEKWSSVSGASNDTACVLFENVIAADLDSTLTGGSLARVIMGGYVYKDALVEYDANAKTALGGVEQTDATGITVVKF